MVKINSINFKIKEHKKVIDKLKTQSKNIDKVIEIVYKKLKLGGKLLLCGNGGSAADAQHLAAEFLIRLRPNINRDPIPAMTLSMDTSTLTACGNDYKFEDIFLRPFDALVQNDDVLLAISTSGNSKNILKVLSSAKKKRITTVGFLGNKGGKAKNSFTQAIPDGFTNAISKIEKIKENKESLNQFLKTIKYK